MKKILLIALSICLLGAPVFAWDDDPDPFPAAFTGADLTLSLNDLYDNAAESDNVLEITNTTSFTPTSDYHPSTKKYVDDNVGLPVSDTAYGSGWNGSLNPATKNAIYDKIETLGGSGDMLSTNNLSDVASSTTSASNLGLGTANSPTFTGLTVTLSASVDTINEYSSANGVLIDGVVIKDNKISTNDAVDIATLSATGTASAATYLCGDNTWKTPSGSGDVAKVGTPVNNQVGVWTGDGTIEGDAEFTFDTTTDSLSVGGNIGADGSIYSYGETATAGRLILYEAPTNGSDSIWVTAPASITANYTLIFPAGQTASNGMVRTYNTDGTSQFALPVPDGSTANDILQWSGSEWEAQSQIDGLINDSAGDGDTNAVWSANKLFDEFALKSTIADPTFTGEIGIGSVNVSETELGILEGATLTTTEINYVDGVTSAIQTQLGDKAALAGAAFTGTVSGHVGVISKSSAHALSTTEAGGYLTIGTAAMVLTLPTAVAGYSGCFLAGQGVTAIIQLTPGASDYLVVDGARGTVATAYASDGSAGDKICFIAADDTDWYITSEVGTWSE